MRVKHNQKSYTSSTTPAGQQKGIAARPFFKPSRLFFQPAHGLIQKQDRPPAAAQLPDNTPAVTRSDRDRFNDLRTFIQGLPQEFAALLLNDPPLEPWMTADNPNVQAVIQQLNRLVADLAAENFVLRFDHPGTGNSGASYDSLNNVMHLQQFSNDEERNMIAADLFHEYTHVGQDRTSEQALGATRIPQTNTRAEELQGEVEARQMQVYFSGLLQKAGHRFGGSQRGFNAAVSDGVFRSRFEQARTAATAGDRAAATQQINDEISEHYTAQLDQATRIRNYSITITAQNHAELHHDVAGHASPHNLGELPASLTNTTSLRGLLQSRISTLAFFPQLFDNPGGDPFLIATFFVTHNNQKITELGLNHP